MTLGAVIVTWNSGAHIGACLDALRRHEPSIAIAVVDNASSDNTLSEAQARTGILLASNRKNRGFAAAVNQGIEMLPQCGLILVLNPDAIVQTNLSAFALQFADSKTALRRSCSDARRAAERIRAAPVPTAAALGLSPWFESSLAAQIPSTPYRCLDLIASVPCRPSNAGASDGAARGVGRGGRFDEGFIRFGSRTLISEAARYGRLERSVSPPCTRRPCRRHSSGQLERSAATCLVW